MFDGLKTYYTDFREERMSYGKAEKPCIAYKYWPANPGLCGVCAWEKDEHNGAHVRSNLEPHQIRMVHELRDLEEKREKLDVFLGGPACRTLHVAEARRMADQLRYMALYASVLRERISVFLPERTGKGDGKP